MKKNNILLSIAVIVATVVIYFATKIPAPFSFYALVTVILIPVLFISSNFNQAYKLLIVFIIDGGGFGLLFFFNTIAIRLITTLNIATPSATIAIFS